MSRWPLLICVVMLILTSMSLSLAQDAVPTLTPPTLVPVPDTGANDALLAQSGVARIQSSGQVRVGILYNEPPFGELNMRGEVSGFDAELARSLAETWGVEVELVQVTRQTATDMLLEDQVDLLIAAQVHRRELDTLVEFSQAYYMGTQSVLVREGDGAAVLAHFEGRKIGVVIGTPSEDAVAQWQTRTQINITVQTYMTLDLALRDLLNNQVDGIVESHIRLSRLITEPGIVRFVEEPITFEPIAVAVRRQDVNLRSLVNRTLQFLTENGRMAEISSTYFPGDEYTTTVPTWANIGEEAPHPDQFATDVPYPAQYVFARIQGGQPIRVAGLTTVAEDAPESEKRLLAINRSAVEGIAALWGVSVEYIPDSAANALELVASGQADLAVGISPDWAFADRVDFTSPYLLQGQRLMVVEGDNIESFNELRGGKWVGIFASEPGTADRVNQLADSVNTSVNIYTMIREQDTSIYILEEENADVVFGDSLKLIPLVQANPEIFRMTTRPGNPDPWYSRIYRAFAVPRNDIDFRLLVEYSLQELERNGTLAFLQQPVMLPEERLRVNIWPGPSEYMGIALYPRNG